MRRFTLFAIGFVITLGVALAFFAWSIKTELVAGFLSHQLRVPVSMGLFDVHSESAEISRLWIGTPLNSRTNTSFASQEILTVAPIGNYVRNPLVIESIDINNIIVGIENYNADGSDNNWSRMMGAGPSAQPSDRQWLIRRITLRNLTVIVTDWKGTQKRYPTIPQITLTNVSSESGFPISEIEKAIFHLMLQDLIRQLDLGRILQQYAPSYIPKGVPLPF